MESNDLQKLLFQHIKATLPTHFSLAEEIADLLEISTDSSYRRIRGEKPISFEEIQKLCRKYKISLDQLLSIDSNSTVFYGNYVDENNFDFEKYLKDMLLQVTMVSKASKQNMYFEAKDIPPFHHFQFPELAAFKYFFWMKTILAYPEYNKLPFEENDLKDTLFESGNKIISTYSLFPSVEIWSSETINSSIRQIEFYRESGLFSKKETPELLYTELEKLVNHIEKQAESGRKFMPGKEDQSGNGSFQLYFNEVFLGHNTILIEADDSQTVFINHGVLNYMITHDDKFVGYTKKTMENTMRKSSLISSTNEKERHRFFNLLRSKIERRKVSTQRHGGR